MYLLFLKLLIAALKNYIYVLTKSFLCKYSASYALPQPAINILKPLFDN